MNEENLKVHVSRLCDILNDNKIENKIKTRIMNDGKMHGWDCLSDPYDEFMGGILSDKNVFKFLKENGFIDIGVCWMCGEEPIKNKFQFTSGRDPSIKFYICKSCYNGGRLMHF